MGEMPHLARIDHHHCMAGRTLCHSQVIFQAPGGFHHNQGGQHGSQLYTKLDQSPDIMRYLPNGIFNNDGHTRKLLRHINTTEISSFGMELVSVSLGPDSSLAQPWGGAPWRRISDPGN